MRVQPINRIGAGCLLFLGTATAAHAQPAPYQIVDLGVGATLCDNPNTAIESGGAGGASRLIC
jgi:hypothetical protein